MTAEIRQGKKADRRIKKIEATGQKYSGLPYSIAYENACQKLRPDSLKMHQKAFGGRAPPGPAGGA